MCGLKNIIYSAKCMRLLYDWGARHQNGTLLQTQTCCIQIVTKSDLSCSNCYKVRLILFKLLQSQTCRTQKLLQSQTCRIQRAFSGDGLISKRREFPNLILLTSTRCILAGHPHHQFVACSLRKVYLPQFTKLRYAK